jgi:hypothetical protein
MKIKTQSSTKNTPLQIISLNLEKFSSPTEARHRKHIGGGFKELTDLCNQATK